MWSRLRFSLPRVVTSSTILALAAGLCLTASASGLPAGPVFGWGYDASTQANAPLSVDGIMGNATAIAAATYQSCAIQSGTGAVVCWGGLNPYGEETPPASVNGTSGSATAIAAGTFHNCAIQSGTGAVVCWGDNFYGQLDVPASVNGTSGGATAIAAGGYH